MAKFVYLSFIAVLLVWHLSRAEVLSATSASFTSSPTASHYASSTGSLDTLNATSSPDETTLHIPVQTALPDPIGFAHVSGFYGPGTWAGWFLTLCASWVHLFRDKPGFDLNTWLYMLGMNWAAIDLLMQMHQLGNIPVSNAGEWMMECASIGAAYTLIFWGLLHASCQMILSVSLRRSDTQRWLTLVVGLLLPSIALTVSIPVLGILEIGNTPHEPLDYIPALYFDGMWASGDGSHDYLMFCTSFTGVWCLLICTSLLLVFIWLTLSTESMKTVKGTWSFIWRVWKKYVQTYYMIGWIIATFVMICLLILTKQFWPFWLLLPFAPILLMAFVFFWPIYVGYKIAGASIVYFFMAYITRGTSLSQSCFFMPCAPQSIAETDQAFTILAGVFSFVVPEFVIPLIQQIRANRRTRILLGDVERRIELSTRPRTEVIEDTGVNVR
jgi:hypothetical protein